MSIEHWTHKNVNKDGTLKNRGGSVKTKTGLEFFWDNKGRVNMAVLCFGIIGDEVSGVTFHGEEARNLYRSISN